MNLIVYKIQISIMENINSNFVITFLGDPKIDIIVHIVNCKNGTTEEYHVLFYWMVKDLDLGGLKDEINDAHMSRKLPLIPVSLCIIEI